MEVTFRLQIPEASTASWLSVAVCPTGVQRIETDTMTRFSVMRWTITVLSLLVHPQASLALYEDQVGMYDW